MANEEKQIKVNLDPVLYALSNFNVGFNEELFDFLMVSGNQARQFRASPKHAKRIYLLLGKYLAEYERSLVHLKLNFPKKRKLPLKKSLVSADKKSEKFSPTFAKASAGKSAGKPKLNTQTYG